MRKQISNNQLNKIQKYLSLENKYLLFRHLFTILSVICTFDVALN